MRPMISEGVRTVVDNSITQSSLGEEVNYEIFMTTVHTPEGMGLAMVVMLAIPSIEIGQFMIAPIMFNTPMPSAEDIDRQVQLTVTGLRAAKAKVIAQANNGDLPGVPLPGSNREQG